jgi:hypothetical protein
MTSCCWFLLIVSRPTTKTAAIGLQMKLGSSKLIGRAAEESGGVQSVLFLCGFSAEERTLANWVYRVNGIYRTNSKIKSGSG